MTAIDEKWATIPWIGAPVDAGAGTAEGANPDGRGRSRDFEHGTIDWSPQTGAHEVHGAIRDHWAWLGAERFLGYPITDETGTPDGVGRYNHFENGSIYWTPETGAWEVHGAIRDKWASMGWERSQVGYPTSDEHGPSNHRSNKFQHGMYLTWTPADGVILETSYGDDYEQNPV
ncbi:LGFP repeat-containing protein [Streptomyces sp. NPDC004596]|uniref:LGFP repeat-containing protein n=1 Tax=Streptomyces sp. DSM 118148 TaxID=3448667 RepID=UPI00404010D8